MSREERGQKALSQLQERASEGVHRVELKKPGQRYSHPLLHVYVNDRPLRVGDSSVDVMTHRCPHHGAAPHLYVSTRNGKESIYVCLLCSHAVALACQTTGADTWLNSPEESKPLSEDDFVLLLLFCIRLQGIRYLRVDGGRHHALFERVFKELCEMQKDPLYQGLALPSFEFDQRKPWTLQVVDRALLQMITRKMAVKESSPEAISIIMTDDQAQRLVRKTDDLLLDLLQAMAQKFARDCRNV